MIKCIETAKTCDFAGFFLSYNRVPYVAVPTGEFVGTTRRNFFSLT